MKTRLCVLLITVILCVGTCLITHWYVITTMRSLDEMCIKAVRASETQDRKTALSATESMLKIVQKNDPLLEMLVPHEDLHEMSVQLLDAHISLSIDDMDDFFKAIRLLRENIDHLMAHESISMANIF